MHRIEREGVPLQEIRRVEPLSPASVVYVRPWSGDDPPPAPSGRDDPDWVRIEAPRGVVQLDRVLHGQPGYVAVRVSSSGDTPVKLLWRYYLELRVWFGDERVFAGAVVPFQYRGTENFPSVMPIEIPARAEPTWILADVAKTRQIWTFGIYAPAARSRWHDAD